MSRRGVASQRSHPNKSESWADNAATVALTTEILILRTAIDTMMIAAMKRESLIEHYKSMLRGFVAEVMHR